MSSSQKAERVAVITGASSGIGEATARALTADGHRVALLARRADRIQTLAAELGDQAIAIEADVTDRDSLVSAAKRVQAELGGADILVNNARVMLLAPFSSDQRDELRQMIDVNLLGALCDRSPAQRLAQRDPHPPDQPEPVMRVAEAIRFGSDPSPLSPVAEPPSKGIKL